MMADLHRRNVLHMVNLGDKSDAAHVPFVPNTVFFIIRKRL